MSIHEKILIHNLFKDKEVDELPTLPHVEPEPYMLASKVKWKNKKLENTQQVSPEKIHEICEAISNGKIKIDTPADLANLLCIPTGQLLHIIYYKRDTYKKFSIKKRNGDDRIICAPNNSISILQERMKVILDFFYRPKKCAHGFIKSKSIITNSENHKKKRFVVNIDLENYFDSITFPRVYGLFKSRPFNFSHATASIAAQLCTYNNVLPQGASTSPVLANIVSASLDKQLTQIAKRNKITYTRYADDITFSFNQYPMEDIFRSEDGSYTFEIGTHLKNTIETNGFKIKASKFRVQQRNERQVVTGLVVNEKVNIERKYIKATRSMVIGWCNDRVAAINKFIKIHNIKAESPDAALSKFRNHIYGRLSFIRQVRGDDFPVYLKLMSMMGHNDPKKTKEGDRAMKVTETYDVFICHASEDKKDIAKPIYEELEKKDIVTFIDDVEIQWGDSLLTKINSALAKSKYVIAILSESSVEKAWPVKELNSVLSREIKDSKTKLLTLMKKGDEEKVFDKLPLIEDKLYMVYDNNPAEVAEKIETLLRSAKS